MTAFVLGNGVSRRLAPVEKLMQLGTVYGCNALYREHTPHVLIATDHPIANAIQRSGYSLKNRFHTRRPVRDFGAQPIPEIYFGYSSGPVAASLAALDHHSEIYLIGFDLGPTEQGKFNNVFAGTEFYKPVGAPPTFTGNWIKQLSKIMKDFPQQKFVRILGDTTKTVEEFTTYNNYNELAIKDFLDWINTSKDL